MQIELEMKYSEVSPFGICMHCGAGLINVKGEQNKAECVHVIVCEECKATHAQMAMFEDVAKMSNLLRLRGKLTQADSDRSPFFNAIRG